MQFIYEDGQGHVVDENGVEPIDLAVDEKLFAIETISNVITRTLKAFTRRKSQIGVVFLGRSINSFF